MSDTAITANLSPSEIQKAVVEASNVRIRATATDTSAKFVASIKGSAMFQNNWDELLSAAPMSISLLGSCLIAASSSTSTTVTLTPPRGGFQFLSYKQLRPNMIQIVDTGRECFRIADSNMDFIAQASNKMYDTLDDVVNDLSGTPQDAKDGLDIHMDILKKGALECKEKAVNIDTAFGDWLKYVNELHQVSEETMGDNDSKKAANDINLKVQDILLDKTSIAEQTSKKAVESLGENLKVTREAFKKASDNYPSGWDLVGMDLVSGLGNCVISAANGVVQKLTGGGSQQQQQNGKKAGGNQSSNQKAPLPKYWDDPAYTQILAFSDPISTLRAIVVGGADGGVDWEGATGKSASGTLVFVKTMLATAKSSFTSTGNPPSVDYQTLLDDSLALVTALMAVTDKKTAVGWKAPDPKSDQVKQWQAKVTEIYSKASALSATAKTMPGVGGNPAPLLNQGNQSGNMPSGGSLAEKALSSAATNLKETQAAMVSTQDTYLKSTENLAKIQASLADIKGQLEKLKADSITLEQIRAILIKCIDVICDLKVQIGKLVQFFDALATMVTFATDYHVTPFLVYLDKIIAGLPQGPGINGFTFTDLQRQNIFSMTLFIRGYYSIFNSIALMYGKISKQWIMPGMAKVLELSKQTDDQDKLEKKRRDLNAFTTNAQQAIHTEVTLAQQKMLAGMEQRVKAIANETKLLPPPPPAITKAIEQGSNVVADAAQKSIEAYKPSSASQLKLPRDD
ncbi:hypothetical protein SS1G_13030 [Sclerotinia sclerotiorum 1980 UF-70]|uniref:Uncharacterized protein n=2 Tax=Sclerotinia sclerotiorum (strain ATCC 18683 / 1980 / Ss-1) TaxID=665079 RepID=A0A1D9PXH3_SCLS1|nr:hypothetical protein SS1G_13030 [Sclerotinia sclerotiorum 1980 UF-70]APA07394.1 hypothetical protein sscle_02g021640 [Sclerotinia sclerotiorum 1980 UF-70]EDN98173.1 hypothetical protein SS1G_13030 [Sclerotinia sclerotiorum 1980 UF-70]